MKEKVLYYCEKCGTAYASKKDAIACEAFHKTPKKIVTKNNAFKPKNVGPAWPIHVRVQDERGNSCQYVYDGHEK